MTDNYTTVYIVPEECPMQDVMLGSGAWGKVGAVKFKILNVLVPKINVMLEKKPEMDFWLFKDKVLLTWTCAGCTKSMGENHCPKRKCKLGGQPLTDETEK